MDMKLWKELQSVSRGGDVCGKMCRRVQRNGEKVLQSHSLISFPSPRVGSQEQTM